MSILCIGLTHCSNCWKPLDMNELGLCRTCQEAENKEKEKYEQEIKERKLRDTIREEAKDIMKEFTSVMMESKRIDDEIDDKTSIISISSEKPEDMPYSDWYADIGYKIMKEYFSGNKQVKIRFEEEK